MSARTLGAHNLHDNAGVPTFFADVILFTEAIPATIVAKVRARRANLEARLSGYTVRVCREQRDLVVALRRRHYKVTGTRYELVHEGRAEVTPHRGIFAVETLERGPNGRRVVFIVEHRINAAFPPFIRGEGGFRRDCWDFSYALVRALIEEYREAGWEVRAGGDLNTPNGVKGYDRSLGLMELGTGFDRLASTDTLRNFEVLTRKGSDHPRIRAVAS